MSQKEKTWFPVIQRRGESVLMTSYLMTAYQDQYYQEIWLLPRGIHDTKYLDGFVIVEADDVGQFSQTLAECLSPEYLNFILSRCYHETDRLLSTAHEIRSKVPYDSMTNNDLLLLFAIYSNDVIRLMPFLFGLVTMEGVLQKAIEEMLKNHFQQHDIKADVRSNLYSLVSPKEMNLPSLAIIELFKLAVQVHTNPSLRKVFDLKPTKGLPMLMETFPEFMKKFNAYIDQYDFMNMEYYEGSPLTSEELFERIKDVINEAKDRLAHIKQGQEKAKSEFEQVCKKFELTPELLTYINAAKEIHYLRQHRADSLYKAGRDVIGFMGAIAKRFGLDYNALVAMTWQEISESLLKGQLTVDREIISARQTGYGILLVDKELSFITGGELAKEIAALPKEKEEVVKEIQGDIAFKGKYRGRVVIVSTSEEIDKVQRGDVLVSPETDPYYVPAMVKAGAIITNEGGILSHASIVSRELGIPCIIGTRIATSVLKDGDIVEVDASDDKGIITVLEGEN